MVKQQDSLLFDFYSLSREHQLKLLDIIDRFTAPKKHKRRLKLLEGGLISESVAPLTKKAV